MSYLWLSIKLQFRIPVSIFFSLVFPLIMMFAMLSSYGNFEIGNGYSFIDKYFLISTGMGMLPISLISFPIWVGESIQNKSYQRLEYFGIDIHRMIISDVLSYILLTLMSILVNITFGFFVYNLSIPAFPYFILFIAQSLYCNLVILVLGSIIALLVKNTRVLMPLGMIFLFSTYILTGAFSTFSELPASFQNLGKYLPIKYVMNNFFDIWTEKHLLDVRFLVLNTLVGGFLVVVLLTIFAIKKTTFFRGKSIQ